MRTASKLRFVLAITFAVLLLGAGRASAAVDLPGGKTLGKVDFERHIMGLFGRTGCNAGGCHGSFQGKGGFRLSLFGYEPEKDFIAITRDSLARRINPIDPDNSLLLLKATGQCRHGGGMRFGKGTWQYQIIREWIVNGTPSSKGRRSQGGRRHPGRGRVQQGGRDAPAAGQGHASPTAPRMTSPRSATSAPMTTPSPR